MVGDKWAMEGECGPRAELESIGPQKYAEIHKLIRGGANSLIQCKGGIGQAGMNAARIMVETGAEPTDAIERVRAVRPGEPGGPRGDEG